MKHILRDVVNDIIVNLNQFFDDKEILPAQVAYWVISIGNRLKSKHIEKRDSGAFLTTFSSIPVMVGDGSKNLPKGRRYIELPASVYDFNEDKGIDYISYVSDDCDTPLSRITFNRTKPSAVKRLYMSNYEKPTPINPSFYRSGNTLFLLGIECVLVKEVEVGVYASLDPVTEICLDDEFDFPEELLSILQRQVLDLGRFILMIPEERVNDGANTISSGAGMPTQKITSVNDLN